MLIVDKIFFKTEYDGWSAVEATGGTLKQLFPHPNRELAAWLNIHANKMCIKPKSIDDLRNMLKCLRLKINQNDGLLEKLLATQDELIIEDITNRPGVAAELSGNSESRHTFWGMAHIDSRWQGTNALGRLWQQVRTECKRKYT